MMKTGPSLALELLDEVQHLPQLLAFDPASFIACLHEQAQAGTEESLGGLRDFLDGFTQVLAGIEAFSAKAMGIRLTHLIAGEPVPQKLRTLLISTVTSYADDPGLLRRRLAQGLRMEPARAAALAEVLGGAAEEVLSLRRTLREGVIGVLVETLPRLRPFVARAAKDRSLPEREREAFRRARADLDELMERPGRIEGKSSDERQRSLTLPEEDAEIHEGRDDRFSLIEVD